VDSVAAARIVQSFEPPRAPLVVADGVDVNGAGHGLRHAATPTVVINLSGAGEGDLHEVATFWGKAVAAIRAGVPSARVVAVTRDPLPADWPVPPGVELAAAGHDVRPLLHDRTVGAAAAGGDAEALPAVLEPMAAGIPVVVTSRVRERLGGAPDSELRVADDPVQFARCVVELLEGDAARRRAGEAARHFAATNWSWDVHAGRLAAILDEVVKGPAQGPTGPPEPSPVAAELGS
jgi:hypothetical protein